MAAMLLYPLARAKPLLPDIMGSMTQSDARVDSSSARPEEIPIKRLNHMGQVIASTVLYHSHETGDECQ